MDVSHILDGLNDAQRQAVCLEGRYGLVLAGAGSGKTRVLIHRMAWLTEVMGVSPYGILAVTFTNKAAQEMRQRAEALMGHDSRGLWVGTFHSIANRLLRMHPQEAGLPADFQILDSEDQLRLVKRLVKEFDLNDREFTPKSLQWLFNQWKDEGLRPDKVPDDPRIRPAVELYREYERLCQLNGVVDFAELLLRTLELLQHNEPLRQHYKQRFSHVLVDEFQDTNEVQYRWLQTLAGPNTALFAVGDDDQSIYAWRGARVENLQDFSRLPGVELVRLEQNYRSTQNILDAANAVIRQNSGRLGKELWTDRGAGERIRLHQSLNETDEARFVVGQIRQWQSDGGRLDEVAVLYRTNAQSRVLEEALIREGLPYRIYGGIRFYERAEIKDALAWMRLGLNPHDGVSFERVVNVPTRGVGATTVARIRQQARDADTSLFEASRRMLAAGEIRGKAASGLGDFLQRVAQMEANCAENGLEEAFEAMLEITDLLEHYRKEPEDKFDSRRENLQELINAASLFVFTAEDEEAGLTPLQAFLNEVTLDSAHEHETPGNQVQLMTLHSAKGLEFPLVFITGMEEGLFPSSRSLEEPERLEEERRLCYVGMTRARDRLVLSYTLVRRVYGSEMRQQPSRFLLEIPAELLEKTPARPAAAVAGRPTAGSAAGLVDDSLPFRPGDSVRHHRFGEGVVLGLEGQGPHARIQVQFAADGVKWLVQAYARLEKI